MEVEGEQAFGLCMGVWFGVWDKNDDPKVWCKCSFRIVTNSVLID